MKRDWEVNKYGSSFEKFCFEESNVQLHLITSISIYFIKARTFYEK